MYNADYVLRIRNYAYTWYVYSQFPDPETRLKIPLSPGNGNLSFSYPPIPRGSFSVGELASLFVNGFLFTHAFFLLKKKEKM
jgi:hypothetical protein